MIKKQEQRLHWSLGKPLRYMGFTLDEWVVGIVGIGPGIYLMNTDHIVLGCSFFLLGIGLTFVFRKVKGLSENFLVKSWLLSRGFIPAPSKRYPHMLDQQVGK